MADPMATAKAARAEGQKEVDRSHAEYKERTKGFPTPNQEECDLIKLGAPVVKKAETGAGQDPGIAATARRGGPAGAPGRAA